MKIYTGKRMRVTDPFLGIGTGQHEGWGEHTALITAKMVMGVIVYD